VCLDAGEAIALITIDVQAGSTRDSTVYRFCIQA